jgi:hypothetical protein
MKSTSTNYAKPIKKIKFQKPIFQTLETNNTIQTRNGIYNKVSYGFYWFSIVDILIINIINISNRQTK